MNARKTLLFDHKKPWMKKNGEKNLSSQWVAMIVLKFASLSVHLFLIKQVPLCKNRLFRDNTLDIFRNLSRSNIERKKKEIIKIFKKFWVIYRCNN